MVAAKVQRGRPARDQRGNMGLNRCGNVHRRAPVEGDIAIVDSG